MNSLASEIKEDAQTIGVNEIMKKNQNLRNEIKKNELKSEHDKYIQSLIMDTDIKNKKEQFSLTKRFLSYIIGRRQENVSISVLREGETEMANILNMQYESVFKNDSGTLPDKGKEL